MSSTLTTHLRWMNFEELRLLAQPHPAPCVSLYLDTHPGGAPDDRARYAGLVREARAALEEFDARLAGEVAQELEALFSADDWRANSAGLVVFRAPGFLAAYRLPTKVPARVVVGPSFHIRPLLDYLHTNQRYFLLLLNQGRAQLFKGGLDGLVAIERLNEVVPPKGRGAPAAPHERHAGARSGGAGSIFYSHAPTHSARDEELKHYFRELDRELTLALRDERAPLIVAAADPQWSLFASVCRNPHLLREGLHGNFHQESGQQLHARAWPLVQGHIARLEDEVLERYQFGVSSGRSSDEVSLIARAALAGRVRELLIERGANVWGRVDPDTGALELTGARHAKSDDDVLDDLAEAVILRGGEAFSLERARMPSSAPVAATLRW